MRRRHSRARHLDQFFKSAVAKVAKHCARCLVGVLRELSFYFRIDVAGHHEQVWVTIVVEVGNSGSPTYVARFDADARRSRHIIEVSLPVVAIKNISVVREVCLEKIQVPIQIIVAAPDAHSRLLHADGAKRHSSHYAFLTKRSVMIVHERQARCRVRGHVDVGPSVFVKIGGNHGHAIGFAFCNSCLMADIGECSITIVSVERMPPHRQPTRSTFDGNSFPIAVAIVPRYGRVFQRKPHVVGNEQVQMTVAVVIQKTASCSPSRPVVSPPSGLSDIRERSIAVVAVENVLSEIGAENIVKAIVVVVPDTNSACPTLAVQPRFLGDVRKISVTIVLVEPVGCPWWTTHKAYPRTEKNCQPTVVGDTATVQADASSM